MSCLTHPILDGLVCGALLHAATRVHLNETYVTDGTCVRACASDICPVYCPVVWKALRGVCTFWSPSTFLPRRPIVLHVADWKRVSQPLCLPWFDVRWEERTVAVPMETASTLISDAVLRLHRDWGRKERKKKKPTEFQGWCTEWQRGYF